MKMSCRLESEYEVRVIHGLLENEHTGLLQMLSTRRALVITTPTVHRYHGDKLQHILERGEGHISVHVINADERNKTIDTLQEICWQAGEHNLDRNGVLIALGGGVCSDLVGFAASIIRRGISHLRIPTTLIGQVDAGIGLKTAVNFRHKKNHLGTFFAPMGVFVDPLLLATLDAAQIRQGLAEIVKMALICDYDLFERIEARGAALVCSRFQRPADDGEYIIRRSIALMLDQLGQNPYENKTFERLVDFGHTFSPLIEAASDFSIPHGIAVGIDMALTCLLSAEIGVMSKNDAMTAVDLLARLGLPIASPLVTYELCEQAMQAATAHRGGSLNLVIPHEIGKATFVRKAAEITPQALRRSIEQLHAYDVKRIRTVRAKLNHAHAA